MQKEIGATDEYRRRTHWSKNPQGAWDLCANPKISLTNILRHSSDAFGQFKKNLSASQSWSLAESSCVILCARGETLHAAQNSKR